MTTIGPGATRVLIALLTVQARDGRATVREVAKEAGRAISTTYEALQRLARFDLVEWSTSGTLRAPLAVRVP